jgi:hypothetical protein
MDPAVKNLPAIPGGIRIDPPLYGFPQKREGALSFRVSWPYLRALDVSFKIGGGRQEFFLTILEKSDDNRFLIPRGIDLIFAGRMIKF